MPQRKYRWVNNDCPECDNGKIVLCESEYGEFYGCSNYPSCEFSASVNSVNLNNSEKECPICKKKLVLRAGKYGEFFGCSDYPECRYSISYHELMYGRKQRRRRYQDYESTYEYCDIESFISQDIV